MGADVAVDVFVTGRVQGVWYRQSCVEEAVARGVAGWVRNLPDGRVEVWMEGPRGAVEGLLAWCREGPPRAAVWGVDIHDAEPTGLSGFGVRGAPS